MYHGKCAAWCAVFRLALTLLNHGKWLLGGIVLKFFLHNYLGGFSPGLGSCNYYRRGLEGCLLSRHGPRSSASSLPPPGPAPSAPRAARQLRSIRNRSQLRTVRKGNFGVKRSAAPARLSSGAPPPRSLRELAAAFWGAGSCWEVPRAGSWGAAKPRRSGEAVRGGGAPGPGGARGRVPRRLGRCSRCERPPPSLLRPRLVPRRAGSAPSGRACACSGLRRRLGRGRLAGLQRPGGSQRGPRASSAPVRSSGPGGGARL